MTNETDPFKFKPTSEDRAKGLAKPRAIRCPENHLRTCMICLERTAYSAALCPYNYFVPNGAKLGHDAYLSVNVVVSLVATSRNDRIGQAFLPNPRRGETRAQMVQMTLCTA